MPATKRAVNCSDFGGGVTGPVCRTAEAVGVTHVPLTKPATFWIGIFKAFSPERDTRAVIYTSLLGTAGKKKTTSFLLRQWEVGQSQERRLLPVPGDLSHHSTLLQPLSPPRLCPCTLRGDDGPEPAPLPWGTAGCPRGDGSLLAGRARLTGSPTHARFSALPPSPSLSMTAWMFLAVFKNAFWHSVLIRH